MRGTLVRVLLRTTRSGERGEEKRGRGRERGAGRGSPLFLSLLNWACQSADAHWEATLTALDLLQEVFEVISLCRLKGRGVI